MSRHARLSWLSLAAVMICSSGCQALRGDSEQRPQVTTYIHTTEVIDKFEPSWLPLIAYATAHVENGLLNDDCYEIWLWSQTEGERLVTFSRKLVTVETGNGDEVLIKPKEGCPKGPTFAFDNDGKFVRMVEWRD